ncbi:DUF3618 domain-containing protein [Luteipulveratus sp. YIM 133132]|uniref:DUF3618 domain-containing protein n=1 Tax=Luteipulveratus flavus TaxID=3031728 RepID=A0ABT6C902_9MICO|nr:MULTISPECIES: DUF3618 domain-containing protein [unclassified Luteipulveratus]MDE9366311.1 DUF3618 domain-containing protein [Luteipulveratus sp. YIM 133132]MDF8265402.1 DUF3618 domain-containing protein [Luteipulveratus sp. YIM 133296]
MAEKRTRSEQEIEADLAATRQRLAGTIDELAFRAQPKEIAKRQVEGVKLAANDATRTPDGELRHDKVAGMLGGFGAVALLLGLIRRARG